MPICFVNESENVLRYELDFKKWKMPDNMDCLLQFSMSPGIYKHKSYYL